MDYYEEMDGKVKYRKKRNKKTPKKADHKHEYTERIGKVTDPNGDVHYYPVKICSVCGRITGSGMLFFREIKGEGSIAGQFLFKLEDIRNEHPDLKIINVTREDIY